MNRVGVSDALLGRSTPSVALFDTKGPEAIATEPRARYTLPGGCAAVSTPTAYARTLLDAAIWLTVVPSVAGVLADAGADRALTYVQRGWARGVLRSLRVRLTMEGLEHITPGESYVVVPLHEGFIDAPALFHLPLRLRFVVREELLGYRMIGPMLRSTRQIPICPERGVFEYRRLLRDAQTAIAAGESVVIFPQGTVLGIECAFQAGAFHLARALGRPILPVALTGSHRVWEYPFTPRLREGERMSLRVLPPVSAADVRATSPARLRDRLQREIKAHALDGRMAEPRRFVPVRDGYWDGCAYDIDPAFPTLADDVALHRTGLTATQSRSDAA